MLTEISLHILDIVQNSICSSSNLIEIKVQIIENENLLFVTIKDNGCGMTKEQLNHATDPFFTTRTTRKVGLGISFFKQACEITGGKFKIISEKFVGTLIEATFILSHIDCMPLGDINSTIHALITTNNDIDFIYTYSFNNNYFTLDTREIKKELENIPLYIPDVSLFIKKYLEENKNEVDRGIVL